MKFLLITILLINFLNARTIEGIYKVKFGLFGQVADANVKLEENATNYTASLNIISTGISKYLSNSRQEKYISKGKVIDGIYKPIIFYKEVKSSKKHYKKEYIVDYNNSTINYKRVNLKSKVETSIILDYFTDNDLMTIFLNMNSLVDFNKTKQKIKIIYSNKDKRNIDVKIPDDDEKIKIKQYLKTKNNRVMVVTINQKIFSSKKGELYLSLDQYNVCKTAILKDIIMFGDIKAKLISYKIID